MHLSILAANQLLVKELATVHFSWIFLGYVLSEIPTNEGTVPYGLSRVARAIALRNAPQ